MSVTTLFRAAASRRGDPALAAKLRRHLEGDVLFGRDDRARYATDASIYDIEPIGVVCPKHAADMEAALAIAREEGIAVIARGGGTSQAGQTVGCALILDCSRYMHGIGEVDREGLRVRVQPGVVLDQLNRHLARFGLWFPVDISTSSRATLGGMAANDSQGARSLVYGGMIDNVLAIEATLADGTRFTAAPINGTPSGRVGEIVTALRAILHREQQEIAARWPKVRRNVAGYHLDRLDPSGPLDLAKILVGSEGTLALFRAIELRLAPLPPHRVLGVCHFPNFRAAMQAAAAIVRLGPTAVELVDRTILELSATIPAFRASLPKFVQGQPEALLLVEFAGEARAPLSAALDRLEACMADLGHPKAVVRAETPALQREIWELRKAGVDIVMSMKEARKPVSFIEDCTVPVERLAEYTETLEEIFARHGTRGTWYAHAGAGCLHVRPVLNLADPVEVRRMRAIAEEVVEAVRRLGGSHSGEHGDGIVRSEFHSRLLGPRLVADFRDVKRLFDPDGVLNTAPSKIVDAPRMDERALLRFKPDDRPFEPRTHFDWRAWGGFGGAVAMCNSNGACRALAGGVMCPSFRVTGEEKHVTRGRAQLLRQVLLGRLGPEALVSHEVREALELCVSCKACRRECPTGVDMARFKIEVMARVYAQQGLPWRERLIAHLPRWAPIACRFAPLINALAALPGSGLVRERLLGLSRERPLPRFARPFRPPARAAAAGEPVVLFVDTFTRAFEPENAEAAYRLLEAMGFSPIVIEPPGERPLCCGRTFLAAGMVAEAKQELQRLFSALAPQLAKGIPVVGLEPSCLFTLIDEAPALLPDLVPAEIHHLARLGTTFLRQAMAAGRALPSDRARAPSHILVHGHCHQKAFDAAADTVELLAQVTGAEVRMIESSCCGMAGAFGYRAETLAVSKAMAELALWPAVRAAGATTVVVADGTSCRQQIAFGTGRTARHALHLLAELLP
jgi:FAD/FMN-containing dehydrogenase/Fe-S oxidoreductase